MIDRNHLRQTVLAKRDQLSATTQSEASTAIADRLWGMAEFREAKSLLFYVNFRSEVKTLDIMSRCLKLGKIVAAPLTVTKGAQLIAYSLHDLEKDLRPGYCGIPEPRPQRCDKVDPANLDLVIIPGSVFDQNGGRLGYGGGYYDRFLTNNASQAWRIALCYDMQIIDRVPVQPHDVPVHFVVTETRILKPAKGNAP